MVFATIGVLLGLAASACNPVAYEGTSALTGTWRRGLQDRETDMLVIDPDGTYRRTLLTPTVEHEETGRVLARGGRFLFAPITIDGEAAQSAGPGSLADEVFVTRVSDGRTWLLTTRAMEGWERFVEELEAEPVPTTYCPHFAPLLADQ